MAKPRIELPPEKLAELEKMFRAGIASFTSMAKQFGVSVGWVAGCEDRFGWKRDLSAKIKQDVKRKEQEQIAREALKANPDYKLTEREVTDWNAELIVQVTGSHRAALTRLRGLAEKLLDEIEFSTSSREVLEELALKLSIESEGKDARADLIFKLAGVQGRVASFKQLVDAQQRIITVERDVLRIGEGDGGGSDVERFLMAIGSEGQG